MFSVLLGITAVVELLATWKVIPIFCWAVTSLHWPAGENFVTRALLPVCFWKPNSPIYNSFTIVEFLAYAFFYRKIIGVKWIRQGIRFFMLLFPVFWFLMVFVVKNFKQWNSYVAVCGGIFSVGAALGYYYNLLHSSHFSRLKTKAEFWIATGMLINYACQVPYWGVLNFLTKHKEYKTITLSLANVSYIMNTGMYLIFIYSFLCRINTRTKSL